MPLLIDGHNLIGQMTSLSLDDPNDEAGLVLRLRSYRARTGKRITVIFDHGVPGGHSRLSGGGVHVVFASPNDSADQLIVQRVRRYQNPAALTVVSSDRDVARVAEDVGVRVIPSGEFARRLERAPDTAASPEIDNPVLSEEEIEDWLHLFGEASSPEA